MGMKDTLAALLVERDTLLAKAADGELDEADTRRAGEIAALHAELTASIAAQDTAAKALASIPSVEVHEPDPSGDEPAGGSLGRQFVASAAYRTFRQAHLGGVSDGTPVNIRMAATVSRESAGMLGVQPEWTDDLTYRAPRTLMDLITTGTTDKSYLPYRQLTAVSNGAAVVGEYGTGGFVGHPNPDGEEIFVPVEGGLKPLSSLTFVSAEAKVADYADGTEVTNQELEDDGAIRAIIDANLTANLEDRIQDLLLNGDGLGINPRGLFATTGVQQQAFATDAVTSIRKGFTKLRNVGATVQAVLLNPADDEAWDLLKDGDGRYLGVGPFGSGPQTAWGVPRVACNAVPVGKAIAGDFSTIHFLTRSPIEVLVFNQHKDYAQRNLNYVRAETRAMQIFRAPGKLAVIELKA